VKAIDKFREKTFLSILAHTSVEGYCCAAIAVLICQELRKPYQLRFSEKMDAPNDLSCGHPDAEISTAEQMYLLTRELHPTLSRCSIFPIIVSLSQRKAVNHSFVQDALIAKVITTKIGLDIHGCTKPLLTMLEQSIHPWLGGTKETAQKLLQEACIVPRIGEELKTIDHLTDEEIGRLRMVLEPSLGPLLTQTYISTTTKGNFADIRELSVAIRVCKMSGMHTLALSACLGDQRSREQINSMMDAYREGMQKLLQIWEKREPGKNFYFIPIKDLSPALILESCTRFDKALFSVESGETCTLILCCDGHKVLLERLVHKSDITFISTPHASMCTISSDEKGRFLEYIFNHIERTEIEEEIAP
jgi:hypothetical protein